MAALANSLQQIRSLCKSPSTFKFHCFPLFLNWNWNSRLFASSLSCTGSDLLHRSRRVLPVYLQLIAFAIRQSNKLYISLCRFFKWLAIERKTFIYKNKVNEIVLQPYLPKNVLCLQDICILAFTDFRRKISGRYFWWQAQCICLVLFKVNHTQTWHLNRFAWFIRIIYKRGEINLFYRDICFDTTHMNEHTSTCALCIHR